MGAHVAQMSMNKVIHGAVRRDLRRFNEALDAFRDGDRARAGDLHRAWENFDAQLTDHHEGEHEIAWPGLQALGVDEATIDELDGEHDLMAAELAEARSAMDQLAATASRADADVAAAAMARLESTTVTHLDHEEAEIEPVFVEHVGTPVLKEMGTKFSRRSPSARPASSWPGCRTAPRQRSPRPCGARAGARGGDPGRALRSSLPPEIAPVWR